MLLFFLHTAGQVVRKWMEEGGDVFPASVNFFLFIDDCMEHYLLFF